MAISRLTTVTQHKVSASTSTLDFQHTVDTGTDLLILVMAFEAGEINDTPVQWDRDGTPQSMTQISFADPGTADMGDVRVKIYGLVNPNEGTDYFDIEMLSTVNPAWCCAMNYSGTKTSSVADATDDIDTTANASGTSITDLLATGITAGDFQIIAAAFQGDDGNDSPGLSMNNGWDEIVADTTGGSSSQDFSVCAFDTSSYTDDDVTQRITWQATDENSGCRIRLNPAATNKTSSGDAVMTEVEASGSAKLIIESSGSPAIDEITASGNAGRVLDSSGSPAIDAVEATGTAENVKAGSGNPSIDTVTADGTATKISIKASSGSPSLDEITASGVAENVKAASGSPAIDEVEATGAASQELSATGSPAIDEIQASGTADHILPASGSPAIDEVEASGSAAQELSASGSPAIDAIEASGSAENVKTASGSPAITSPTTTGKAKYYVKKWMAPTGLATAEYGAFTKAAVSLKDASGSPAINEIEASGTAENVKTASGSPSIDAVTASGVAENVKTASGSPNIDAVTASGTAAQTYSATGSPAIDAVTASGTAATVLSATGSATLDEVEATGAAAQELSATGSPSIDEVTASGTADAFGEKTASGSPSIDEITASGTAAQTYSSSGSPSIDAVTASGTATKDLGVQTQRNMGPHGLTASYPDVLREFDDSATLTGATISAEAGNSNADTPSEPIDLGPHGLATKRRDFDGKSLDNAAPAIQGAEIELQWAEPAQTDVTLYPDGQDIDGEAGSVIDAEAQVAGAEIQALAGTSTSQVNISPTPGGAAIAAEAGESNAVPGTGAAISGGAIVAQAGTPDTTYDYAVFGMLGAQITAYHAHVGWDTNFDVGALIYGRGVSVIGGTVTQETSETEKQQGSWGGGGGKGKKRKKFKKRKFHMPLAGVKLRDRPFENPVIEEEIEQIVDDVIEAAEELEAKGYAEAISADIIAEMARLKAATDEALIRGIRNTEAVSRKLAEAKLGARINELVRRRRAYIRVEHERILRDQRERARQQELERKRQREYEIRKARAEWRAELLLNQPIEPYEEPTIDDEADVEAIMQLMEEIL